jgi:amino acid transporter
LVSAVPSLLPDTISLSVGILVVITILNLRGVREAGTAFAVPTYLFVGTLLLTILAGIFRVLLSGGHPTPAVPLPPPPPMTEAVSYWLLLKAFASGCTALTGVEAVSNGIKATSKCNATPYCAPIFSAPEEYLDTFSRHAGRAQLRTNCGNVYRTSTRIF